MEAGYIWNEPGKLNFIEVYDRASLHPRIGEEMYGHFSHCMNNAPRIDMVAMFQSVRGNTLYLKFPKKARRKLKKSVRHHKRWAKNHCRYYDNRILYEEFKRMQTGGKLNDR